MAYLRCSAFAADIGGHRDYSAAIIVSPIHPAEHDLNQDADADYVQGLAKRGIVKLPGYQPRWPF
jgi:hypothetical protein